MNHLQNTLFLDIETVPSVANFEDLSEAMQKHWAKKAATIRGSSIDENDLSKSFSEKAGVYAEFAKVVCIVVGSFHKSKDQWQFRVKTISGRDEVSLLNEFSSLLTRFAILQHGNIRLCGHNIREFDLPFLCRRLTVADLPLPECLQLNGKKPWEVKYIDDTLELWRFGDFKNYTSLALLAEILGIPSPKDDIDGSMVGSVYWQEDNLERIAKYCAKDVLTTAKVFMKLKEIDLPMVVVNVDE